MRIDLDRTRMAAFGLTVQDIESALRAQNVLIPAGRIESVDREFSVVSSTDLQTPQEFADIIVSHVNGYPVRLGDMTNIYLGPEDERVMARFNGAPSLTIGVTKQSTANPLTLSAAVRDEVEEINKNLPSNMQLHISYDSSVFIQESIHSVFNTILEATLLVTLVILFFLRNIRASLIPLVTIPVSLVGAMGLMYAFGFSINTLTLLAMVLAIGLVVDDAIVVLENIFRHIERGVPRFRAAILGIREITGAVIAMTLTLVTVFAPLAFATGRTGRLFIEFALTLAGAVLVSGFVALTLTPMMCSTMLRPVTKPRRLYLLIERFLQRLTRGYRKLLIRALRLRPAVILGGLLVASASAFLFTIIPTELAPTEDRGVIFGIVNAPEGSTLNYTLDSVEQIEALYESIPEKETYQAVIGFPTVTDSFAILRLKHWDERSRSQQSIARELQPHFAALPGVRAFPTNPPSFGQRATSKPVQFVIMSQEPYSELAAMVQSFTEQLADYPGLQNLDTDLRLNTPELRVNIDRDKLADAGIAVDVVGRTLESLLGGRQVTRFESDGEQYDVIVQVDKQARATPEIGRAHV